MLKFTYNDLSGRRSGEVHVNPQHIVSVEHGNPSGSIITLLRGQIHVAQSVDQVVKVVNAINDFYGL